MKNVRRALLLGILIALGGCGALLAPPAPSTVFDLGRIEAGTSPAGWVPAAIEVRAPSWLSSVAMQYRRDYIEPAGREAYAGSRWAGKPPEMLERALSMRLASGNGDVSACRLRIDLDEFIQVFDSAQRSHAEISARAALIAGRDENVVARRSFLVRVAANGADASGGVQAQREGVRTLVAQLQTWLGGIGNSDGAGVRCRSGA